MRDDFSTRLARALADPWLLLTSAFGGGMSWALTNGNVNAGAAIGLGMLGAAALTSAAVKGGGDDHALPEREEKLPELAPGTSQARMVDALRGYLGDLKSLRESKLPDSVTDSAIEALVATDGAYTSARRVAAVVDKLDAAIARSETISGGLSDAPPVGVWESLERMKGRRQQLLGRLDSATGEVAEVYTKLLELSATVDTMDLGSTPLNEVETVNNSLDALRSAFAELEKDAGRVE
jgi:hypothetical protein